MALSSQIQPGTPGLLSKVPAAYLWEANKGNSNDLYCYNNWKEGSSYLILGLFLDSCGSLGSTIRPSQHRRLSFTTACFRKLCQQSSSHSLLVYSQTVYSAPLVCLSVLMPAQDCLCYYSFIV